MIDPGAPSARPIEDCLATGGFLWLTGIEDTFITSPDARTGRTLDEYELTGHYEAWETDLALAAELGVAVMRYGIPWHRVSPAPNRWDFSFPDATLERLLSLGIHPIVDLVHYGTPRWMNDAFLHADYDRYVEEYAFRVAERYRGRVRYYTPLNEPRIAAWYSGKLGFWPPYRRGYAGFVAVMAAICRGMTKVQRVLKSVDPDILCIHADATDLYEFEDVSLALAAQHRQQLVFLSLDLLMGRVTPAHPLYAWMVQFGLEPATLEWFAHNPCRPDVLGINLYPMFSLKLLSVDRGRLRVRTPYARATLIDRILSLYDERYALPLLITETAARGSVDRRQAWLRDSVAAAARARRAGIPLVGYTWWPMFALVRWAYLRGNGPPESYLEQMGLWDLAPGADGGLRRIPTALVDDFRRLAELGSDSMPPLASRSRQSGSFVSRPG